MLLKRKIKVLIVDDSVFFRNVISKELSKDPTIDVVGAAADAFDARDKILELDPDVLTLDVEMPKMNGIEFLKKLMPQYPIPVVVVSAVSGNVFDALDAGAVDFVTKPDTTKSESFNSFLQELIVKIKIASTAKVGHFKKKDTDNVSTLTGTSAKTNDIVIAIGASTGGTEAI
jgi:two-component system chemotaxis response regulator CheB